MADFKQKIQDLMATLPAKNPAGGTSSASAGPAGNKAENPKLMEIAFPKDVKKRWMLIGGVAAVCVAAIGSMSTSTPQTPKRTQQRTDERMVNITP